MSSGEPLVECFQVAKVTRALGGSAGLWPKYARSCIYVSKCYILGLVYYFNTPFKPLIPLQ